MKSCASNPTPYAPKTIIANSIAKMISHRKGRFSFSSAWSRHKPLRYLIISTMSRTTTEKIKIIISGRASPISKIEPLNSDQGSGCVNILDMYEKASDIVVARKKIHAISTKMNVHTTLKNLNEKDLRSQPILSYSFSFAGRVTLPII